MLKIVFKYPAEKLKIANIKILDNDLSPFKYIDEPINSLLYIDNNNPPYKELLNLFSDDMELREVDTIELFHGDTKVLSFNNDEIEHIDYRIGAMDKPDIKERITIKLKK